MKYLLILLAVLAGVWLWRKQRIQQEQDTPRRPPPPQLQDMVRCQVCDLHLPARDAVTTSAGVFCGEEHARRAVNKR